MAAGGTLFLDEIGELPLAVQGKVLRVLEERTYERVGSGKTSRADVRLVAATNRDLKEMAEAGTFRPDLFFRLNVFPIELPPLRERASDVPLLARHLLPEIARRHHLEPPRLDEEAADFLAEQPWPGNVRELANALERAVILAEGPLLREADLLPLLHPPAPAAGEREHLRQALTEAGGDKRRAAEIAGVSYRTLLRKVKELDLEGVPRYRDG
jgi:DNA-binding NtrC family response regulator